MLSATTYKTKIRKFFFQRTLEVLIFVNSSHRVVAAVSRPKMYLGKEGENKLPLAPRLITVKKMLLIELLPGKK